MITFLKSSLLAAVLSVSLSAASWDGQRGDLTIQTMSGSVAWETSTKPLPSLYIFATSSDKTVTAIRVTIRIKDAFGYTVERVAISRVMSLPFVAPAEFLGISEESVLGVKITRMRDGETEDVF